MSRSYKHTPISKDGDRRKKWLKQHANRIVRRKLNDIDYEIKSKSSIHKRMTESWDIADYVCRWPKCDAIRYYKNIARDAKSDTKLGKNNTSAQRFLKEYSTLDKWIDHWKKLMIRK